MTNTIENEAISLNADGVDFVSIGAMIEDGEFIGEIYESYTLDEFKQCESYPRSSRIYWKGTKDNKEYIDIKVVNTCSFVDAIKLLKEGKTISSPFINNNKLFLGDIAITVNGVTQTRKELILSKYNSINREYENTLYVMPTEILFSNKWRIVDT